MKRRRTQSADIFGLSFLDVISCGFGAVILLFILTTRSTENAVQERVADMSGEMERVLQQLEEERGQLAETEEALSEKRERLTQLRNQAEAAEEAVEETKEQARAARLAEKEEVERIARLINEIKQVETQIERLENAQQPSGEAKENAIRESPGEERRHYLTGLRVDGERALILVDVSLSMLDETLAGVLGYRTATPRQKLKSRKWVRVLDSVDWLLATLEAERYQVYLFNETTRASIPGTQGDWLERADSAQLQRAGEGAWNNPPEGGSNLRAALEAAMRLSPRPDNIYILTDGLPTQSSRTNTPSVSGAGRRAHFQDAANLLQGGGTAVHTILFPMQGDPDAAPLYWSLAYRTGGSFFTPSASWPN